VGKTILILRKHKLETNENKRILKAIMEKWSRPIFNKASDSRSSSYQVEGGLYSSEQHEIARVRMVQRNADFEAKKVEAKKNAAEDSRAAKAASRDNNLDDSVASGDGDNNSNNANDEFNDNSNRNSTGSGTLFDGITKQTAQDHRQRVRTPYTTGFYFTVRPENKVTASGSRIGGGGRDSPVAGGMGPGAQEESTKTKLMKKITDLKKMKGKMGGGVKHALGAAAVDLNGRNIGIN